MVSNINVIYNHNLEVKYSRSAFRVMNKIQHKLCYILENRSQTCQSFSKFFVSWSVISIVGFFYSNKNKIIKFIFVQIELLRKPWKSTVKVVELQQSLTEVFLWISHEKKFRKMKKIPQMKKVQKWFHFALANSKNFSGF